MRRVLMGLTLLAAAGAAKAGEKPPHNADISVERGRVYAQRMCAGCHAIGAFGESPNASAPTFGSIRLRYNSLSLPRRLADISENGHYEMPRIHIPADQIQDIVAYVETVDASGAVGVAPGRPQDR